MSTPAVELHALFVEAFGPHHDVVAFGKAIAAGSPVLADRARGIIDNHLSDLPDETRAAGGQPASARTPARN